MSKPDPIPKNTALSNEEATPVSDAAQELISHEGSFMEKWALLIFTTIMVALLSASFFIRYPEVLHTRAVLTSLNGPKNIITLQAGRIARLFITNGTQVKNEQEIAYIETTGDVNEISQLSSCLSQALELLEKDQHKQVSKLFETRYQALGEIQAAYQTFFSALQLYNNYFSNDLYQRKKQLLEEDLGTLKKMASTLEMQKKLASADFDISQESFLMNEKLYKEKIISAEEYRVEQSKIISKQQPIPQLSSALLANQNQQNEKLKELMQLLTDYKQAKLVFREALLTLKSQVDTWSKNYIIKAPVAGTFFLARPLQQNQYLQSGQYIGNVLPLQSSLVANVYLPQYNIGKVNPGFAVQLRIDGYPFQEYGIINGKLSYISEVPTDSGYLATIKIDPSFTTNQNKPLTYKEGLTADAFIILKDQSLFKRFYGSLLKTASSAK